MRLGSGLGATWLDASELFKEGGEFSDMSDMMNMSSMFEGVDFDTSKGVAMSTETRGGVTYEVETLQNGSQVTKLYTVNNDLRMIVSQDQYGTQEIRIQNLSGDVRDSLFTEPVGAVVSTQDTVSHLLTPQSLRKCFSCVSGALLPGGVFVFDVNTAYKMKEVYGDRVFVLEGGDSYTVWENEYLPSGPGVEFRVTVFTETETGTWRRDDGVTRERAWSPRSISNALRETGLEPVFTASAWDLGTVGDETERIVFAAVKK